MSRAPKASFASNPAQSRGRFFAASDPDFRSPWQRDRDRILHSSAFRRLKAKTQVFIADEGDLFRTRLTHTIEVAQVARSMAGALGLDVDLAEAIALSHDLGHPPFGHTGEEALHALMENYGGFDHNAQALRIVTHLEQHYAAFDGLNLSWESLEGIAKHNGPVTPPYPYAIESFPFHADLQLESYASAEAQIAALADDIAYIHHDLQDGLRAGLLREEALRELPIIGAAYVAVDADWPGLEPRRRRYEMLRRVFSNLVHDVLEESGRRLAGANPINADELRLLNHAIIAFSSTRAEEVGIIKAYLFREVYRSEAVMVQRETAKRIVQSLFEALMEDAEEVPERWRRALGERIEEPTSRARMIADYISGMTDIYARKEAQRLVGASQPVTSGSS